jgi:NCS1 family nucleobase:cation symporter-1
MPAVEEYGVEPIPTELRRVGWRDLFAINFTFYLSPFSYVLGALAVTVGGLPLSWAIAAMVVGQMIAFGCLVVVAQPGVDYGLTGQVAFRSMLGYWGARLLSSPYRVIAGMYWFAAQSLACALGFQALFEGLTGEKLPLVPVSLAFAAVYGTLAVLGFDVMRHLLRLVLPLTLVFTGVIIALYASADDPRYEAKRVFESPDQTLTWLGFATVVTVMAGAGLTFVTSIADWCRYTPTRRDMRIGLLASALTSAVVTTFIGGYAAVATGEINPFVAVAELTSSKPLLVLLLVAIVAQTIGPNITNAYTAGLSLVNTAPRLGRFWATAIVAAGAVALSGFPDFVDEAQEWLVHLGNVAAPLTGVILADYLVLKRQRIDVAALFDPDGRYRYLRGVNVAAVLAVAGGVGVYYAVPQSWVKVVWGIAVGAGLYLTLAQLMRLVAPSLTPGFRAARVTKG